MHQPTATAAAPLHPTIIGTGGLESAVGAILAMRVRVDESCLVDAAYSLDAPYSVPAGSWFSVEVKGEARTAQRFTGRDWL